jgi:FMN phosphatase YigB (HAD superfamily)
MNQEILFDVDGTLITFDERPRWDIIEILKILKKLGARITVASGGGKDYAEMWVRRLFLEEFVDTVMAKPIGLKYPMVDIAFDDEEAANFGVVNIKV